MRQLSGGVLDRPFENIVRPKISKLTRAKKKETHNCDKRLYAVYVYKYIRFTVPYCLPNLPFMRMGRALHCAMIPNVQQMIGRFTIIPITHASSRICDSNFDRYTTIDHLLHLFLAAFSLQTVAH